LKSESDVPTDFLKFIQVSITKVIQNGPII